ncbi:hypothetical protein BOX15_Mlig024499g3, partial [Macrostomum lignano]
INARPPKRPQPLGSSSASASSASASSEEPQLVGDEQQQQSADEYNYELELSWCLERLRLTAANRMEKQRSSGSASGGGTPRRQLESELAAIRVLSSAGASKLQKRQAMRQHLGDYRAKMRAELARQQHASAVSRPGTPAGHAVRTCVLSEASNSTDEQQSDQIAAESAVEKPAKKLFDFRFNFDVPDSADGTSAECTTAANGDK